MAYAINVAPVKIKKKKKNIFVASGNACIPEFNLPLYRQYISVLFLSINYMQGLNILLLIFCAYIALAGAMPVINAHGDIRKRQDVANNSIVDPAVPQVQPDSNVVADIYHEDIIQKGDATACGKKVQSEKPSDPAGEFLKCYMS